MGITIPYKMIHPYYTPKFRKFQAYLAKTAFFVDYAHNYVKDFMLTFATSSPFFFTIFNFSATSWAIIFAPTLNIGLQFFLQSQP